MKTLSKVVSMSATAEVVELSGLTAEWRRIELLCFYISRARRGLELEVKQVEQLKHLQQQVLRLRQHSSVWFNFGISNLSNDEYDVLACILAPEFEPRVGWLYQELQPGINQHYPSLALIQELLAI